MSRTYLAIEGALSAEECDAAIALAAVGRTARGPIYGGAGAEVDPARRDVQSTLVARGDFSYESGVAAMETLLALPSRPTAVLASNDRMAHAALRTAKRNGLSVPADVSVISFDNTPLARFADLTAIIQPIAEMSAVAAELLIRSTAGEAELPRQSMVDFGFAARGSTAALKT